MTVSKYKFLDLLLKEFAKTRSFHAVFEFSNNLIVWYKIYFIKYCYYTHRAVCPRGPMSPYVFCKQVMTGCVASLRNGCPTPFASFPKLLSHPQVAVLKQRGTLNSKKKNIHQRRDMASSWCFLKNAKAHAPILFNTAEKHRSLKSVLFGRLISSYHFR